MSRRSKADPAPEVVLPITPMLDMAFQLLTFFILTYHPAGLEGQFELSLPSEQESKSDVPNPKQTDADPPPKVEADVTVVITTPTEGVNVSMISEIIIEEPTGKVSVPDKKALEERLRKVRATAANQSVIKLQADSHLKWDDVVGIADVCRTAGFTNVSFMEPRDFKR